MASALAAGCPVVVKAHNAHPGTAEHAGLAIAEAIQMYDIPERVFSLLFGQGKVIGQALARHPAIKAIAFTGSRAGGTALMETAARRAEPIPVYAEMSSINPVILLKGTLTGDLRSLADEFTASLVLGAGQFCTNPGLLLIPEERADAMIAAIDRSLRELTGEVMLTSDIRCAYDDGVSRLLHAGAQPLSRGHIGPSMNAPAPELFRTTAAQVRDNGDLQEEVFGAAGLVATYATPDDLTATLDALPGQLTITLHMAESDHKIARGLLPVLERKAGRLIANGWPTGVEVNHAMVHGGPYPATSDARSTSVGTLAIDRFQRPVCYQNFPHDLLPEAVSATNSWGIPRFVNGEIHGSG